MGNIPSMSERIANFGADRFGGRYKLFVAGHQGSLNMLADRKMQGVASAQGKVEARQQALCFLLMVAAAGNEFAGLIGKSRHRAEGAGSGVRVEFVAAQPNTEGRGAFGQPPVTEG
jgi:hypothetical protein